MRNKLPAACALAALALTGCTQDEPAVVMPTVATPFTAKGVISLAPGAAQALYNVNTESESSCQGVGGYKDLTYGTSVIVLGTDDTPLATAEIEETNNTSTGCELVWEVPNVRPDQGTYSVQVSWRGSEVEFSQDELIEGVELSIGY